MKGGKNQKPGFRGLQEGSDSFVVSHLTDHQYIGASTQRAANGRRIAVKVLAHLALFDRTLSWRINEFDRIFKSQDVFSPGLVDMVNQAIDRRGFAATGRPGHQNESVAAGFNLAQEG